MIFMAHALPRNQIYPKIQMMKFASLTSRMISLTLVVLILASCTPAINPVTIPSPDATPAVTTTREPTPTSTATLVQEVYLDTLTPVNVMVGAGELGVGKYTGIDASVNGKVLTSHGSRYPNGLLAHAPSRLDYQIDGQYRLFRTQILKQDGVACGDGVVFKVLLDGQAVFPSSVVNSSDAPQDVELDVTGARTLTLVVDQRAGNDCDWSIWGNPVLVRQNGVAVNYATPTLIPTATPDPKLPCGGIIPEQVYLFLDCIDIHRIRDGLRSGNLDLSQAWDDLVSRVDRYRADFPTSYNPVTNYPTIWNGTGNYIARDMALVYLVTGDASIARDEARLIDLVVRGTQQTGGLVSPSEYGVIVYQSLLFGYFAIRDTDLVSPEQRQQYDQFFIRQAGLLEQDAISIGNTTPITSATNRNTAFASNVAALTIASAFPDDPGMQALIDRLRPRLEWQLANWWEQDGGWGENTEFYGLRSLEGLLTYAEVLYKISGENIYEADFAGNSIHTMCTHFLKILTPEGDVPQINDTPFFFADPGTLLLCARRTYDNELLYAARSYLWGRQHGYGTGSIGWDTLFETVAWWDPSMETAAAPAWTSVLLPTTGLGIFRSDWTHDAQYGMLKYTASAVHTHYSFGEFFLYDHGPWLTGNGYHLGQEYDGSAHTASSSTLTLDNGRQTSIGGELLAFVPLNNTGYMAVAAKSYPGLSHTRTVLWNQAGHHWIVVDDAALQAFAGHSLQVRWYVRGQAAAHDEIGNWTFTRTGYPGYLAIQMPSALPVIYSPLNRTYTDWKQGDADGVELQVSPISNMTRIVSVISYLPDQPASLLPITRDDTGQGLLISAQPGDKFSAWDWLLASPGANVVEKSDYSLKGNAGCIWRSSSVLAGYCLFTGTSLNADGHLLVESSALLSLEADFGINLITVDSPSATTIQLYWPEPINAITEAGKKLQFQQKDNVLTIQLQAGKHILLITP